MKKSEYNRGVIENFILHITHLNRTEAETLPLDKEVDLFNPRELYDLVDEYIEVDHVDGEDGDKEGDIFIQ